MKILKKILKFFIYLLVALVAIAVILYLTASIWVRALVSMAVPPITQTTAAIQNVDISLFSGKLAFDGFKLGNPSGFNDPYAFELGRVVVLFDPRSVLTNKIVINSVSIDSTTLSAEVNKSLQINLLQLNNNVQEYLNKSGGATSTETSTAKSTEEKPTSNTGKSVVIKDLQINNTNIKLQGKNIPLPNVHKQNIGEEKSHSVQDMIAVVFSYLTTDSIAAIRDSGVAAFKDGLKNVKDIAKQGKEQLQEETSKIKDFGKNLKDLF